MFPIEIETERLRIREFTTADIDLIFQYETERTGLFFHENPSLTRTDVEQWLEELLTAARKPDRTRHQFGVELRATGTLIGNARCHDDIPDDRQGSIGYAFPEVYWGHGFGTEAATAMVEFGFEQLRLHRIEATIEPDNAASIHVAEKLGMRLEGRMQERFNTLNGWRDSLLYATTEDEWQAYRAQR